MSEAKLPAIFQAQQWIGNQAVDCAEPVHFDAAPSLPLLSLDEVRSVFQNIMNGSTDIDALAEVTDLLLSSDFPDGHGGPFYVKVEPEDLRAFLAETGLDADAELTDEELSEIRSAVVVSSFPEATASMGM